MSEPLRCVVCDTAHDDWNYRGEVAIRDGGHHAGVATIWECVRCGETTEVL